MPPSPADAPATSATRNGVLGRLTRLRHDQRVAFVAVGGFNTVFGAAVFVALELTLGEYVGYLVVLLVAYVIAMLCAFFLHRRLVFRVEGNLFVDLLRFQTVHVGALAINFALLPLLVEVVGLPVIPSQFLIVTVTAVVSFLGHKHFSFRRPRVTT